LTIGDLKFEVSRWSDETPVTFRSPLKEQEFRFYRYSPCENLLVLEINEFPETSPAALAVKRLRCRAEAGVDRNPMASQSSPPHPIDALAWLKEGRRPSPRAVGGPQSTWKP
jgi:hypothetical protein